MLWFIISIIVGIVLFVFTGLTETTVEGKDRWGNVTCKEKKVFKLNKKQLLTLFALVFMIPSFITKVPANSVGIKYSPFSGTSETTLAEGFRLKSPFDKVYKISTETQTKTIENLTSQTQDAQFVTTSLDVQYKVNEANAFLVFKQYRTLDRMSEMLITQTTQRALELVTTKYDVIECLGGKRSDIYEEVKISLTEEFAAYGVEFVSVTINDMDAGEKIENAITDEAVAKKAVETAEQELLKAETEAKKNSVTAQAEQDAAKIKAETKIIEAQAGKEANELLNQSLSDEVLMKLWIERWNGIVPTYYGGNGADLIFNTGSVK